MEKTDAPRGEGLHKQRKKGLPQESLQRIGTPDPQISSPTPKKVSPEQKQKRGHINRFPIEGRTTKPKRK